MDKIETLKYLLQNVSDSYSDFVIGGLCTAKNHNSYDKIIEYLENNPTAKTSDVIKYMTEEILNIKPIIKMDRP